jgi:catechol 2,3-dioxygenase-like lactoylglutathione lyase family enzyme
MKLNHLNLSVKDVPSTRVFFETYLDFTCADTKPNDTLSVLTGPDGFILVLMSQRLNEKGNHSYPDAFHIGFYLSGEKEVTKLFEGLKAGGITLEQEPQRMRKNFGFYFHVESLMIEITCVVKE